MENLASTNNGCPAAKPAINLLVQKKSKKKKKKQQQNNNGNTRLMCGIYLKLTTKTLELRQSHRSSIFIDNFEQPLFITLVFPLLSLYQEIPPRTN